MDKNSQNIWLTLQLHGIADCFVTQDSIFVEPFISQWGFHATTLWRVRQMLEFIPQETLLNLHFCDIPFALGFDHTRPFHAFGDDLYWFLRLKQHHKEICSTRAFFLLNNSQTHKDYKNYIYISPRLYFNFDFSIITPCVTKESLAALNSLVAPQDKLDKFDKTEISESEIASLVRGA